MQLRVHSEEYILTRVGYMQWDVANTNEGTVVRMIEADLLKFQDDLGRQDYEIMRAEDSGSFVVFGRVWMLDTDSLTAEPMDG